MRIDQVFLLLLLLLIIIMIIMEEEEEEEGILLLLRPTPFLQITAVQTMLFSWISK